MLTSFIHCDSIESAWGSVVTWDLQTGGVVSALKWDRPSGTRVGDIYIVYSTDGRMDAALCRYQSSTVISIYDIVSGVYTHDVHHPTSLGDPEALYVYGIWTHGESLRFATPKPTGITIWEVGFVPGAKPTEVETIPIPDDAAWQPVIFEPKEQSRIEMVEFHPNSRRFAFIHTGAEHTLLVWDASASRFLLRYTNINSRAPHMTFSSDGCFFACTTSRTEVCLWKESPTGYTLLEKFAPATPYPHLSLSPNGGSIVTHGPTTIQLWHTTTTTTTTTTSSPLVQPPKNTGTHFILEFSPGRPFAVATRTGDRVVTVFNLKSGVAQLTINTPIDVYGLRLIENTIVVVGHGSAMVWDLPGEDLRGDKRMDIKDSTRMISFGGEYNETVAASISPDFQHIAFIRRRPQETLRCFLEVYCTFTGLHLHSEVVLAPKLWFAPGGYKIWCPDLIGNAGVFTITQDALDRTSTNVDIEDGSWGCPWGSSRGYKVTEDDWILGAGGKRLLMLPPLWRSKSKVDRVWNEKFLALLHGGLPEIVILELEP